MGCPCPLFWLACLLLLSPFLFEKGERPAAETKAGTNWIFLLLKAEVFALAGRMSSASDELSQDDTKVQISPYTNS